MELIVHVENDQIEDMAPRESGTVALMRDKFCVMGSVISPLLTVYADFEKTNFSKTGIKSISIENDGLTQTICGQIVDGYFDFTSGFFLVVATEVLMRVLVKSPHKIEKVRDRYGMITLVKAEKPQDQLTELVVFKGDYIKFSSVIEGMWLDSWESAITIQNQRGTIISRQELPDHSLKLKIKYAKNPDEKYKLDDYHSKFKHVQQFSGQTQSIKIYY